MKPNHADFRPGKRPRFVPSGAPRRKIPLLRIALLIGFGLLVYARFDDYWPRLRAAMGSVSPWQESSGQDIAAIDAVKPVWSRDSSRVTLACPDGLAESCCAALQSVDPDLCGEASALLAKARWKHRVSGAAPRAAGKNALLLEARAIVSDLGDWGFELSGLRGRDGAGVFVFRRAAGAVAWCDAARGCLREPLPRAPLPQGHLQESAQENAEATAQWVSSAPQVLAVLPGRIAAVDSVPGGVRVEVYHGRELYAAYGPLRAAAGVRPGAQVRAGSHLGNAIAAANGAGGHALTVRIRQAGQYLDPGVFWGVRSVPLPSSDAVDGELYSGTP